MLTTIMLKLDFFVQNTEDLDQLASNMIRIHTVFISACKFIRLDN